jgi:hypothetical protein
VKFTFTLPYLTLTQVAETAIMIKAVTMNAGISLYGVGLTLTRNLGFNVYTQVQAIFSG